MNILGTAVEDLMRSFGQAPGPSDRIAWAQLCTQSLDDLYAVLNRLSDTEAYVYRGHASAQWPHLVPSLHRILGTDRKFAETVLMEATAIRAFRRHARSMLHTSELAYFDRILDGITLMQHYGAPTRLLDWTLSPWVACYFAAQGEDAQDAAIWAFNYEDLFKSNHQGSRSQDFEHFRKLVSASTIEDWAMAALHAGPSIDVFRYQYANPQMGAQQSLFTISGKLGLDHDIALAQSLPEAWQTLKIIIPKACKRRLRQRLFKMNVSALALFPTPDGVGRNIREAIQCDHPLGDEGLLWVLEEKARANRSPARD